MKKVLKYIILIILLSTLGIIWTNQTAFRQEVQTIRRTYVDKPCSKPIEYAIGNVDPRFGISPDEFAKDVTQAGNIWDTASGKQMFQYNPNAPFKINLVFDDREQQTLEAEKLNENLGQLDVAHNSTIQKYNSLNATFNSKLQDYNSQVADYEKQLGKYNDEVASWNAKGGAPQDKYDELKKEKSDLNDTYQKLEKERTALNDLAQKTNNVVQEEKNIVNTYNSNIDTYKNKYGGSREFEKGVYDGQEINIYEFKQEQDLELTLIHELGHAIGLGHVSNPQSIMYYMLGDQDLNSPHLSAEDLAELKNVCMIK